MSKHLDGIHVVKKESQAAKPCKVCGDTILRTRRVARDWDQIQYCSAVCRRMDSTHERIAAAS